MKNRPVRDIAIFLLGLTFALAFYFEKASPAQPAIIKQIDIIAGEDPFNREYLQYLEMIND